VPVLNNEPPELAFHQRIELAPDPGVAEIVILCPGHTAPPLPLVGVDGTDVQLIETVNDPFVLPKALKLIDPLPEKFH